MAILENGTVKVKVLNAKNLPTMQYGKNQNPYVLVRYGELKESWAKTDSLFNGGENPEWSEQDNRDLEIYFERKANEKEQFLTVEVWNDDFGREDELIGRGRINITKIINQTTEVGNYTAALKDIANGSANRGEVNVCVTVGPPIRKAFRAAQRAGKIFDVRDSFVGSIYATKNVLTNGIFKAFETPKGFVKDHKKKSILAAGIAALTGFGVLGVFGCFLFPFLILALFTLPFWIIPAALASFATAPLWLPIVIGMCLLISALLAFSLTIGITSRPVRKTGAKLSAKLKETPIGKRIVYEKAHPTNEAGTQ